MELVKIGLVLILLSVILFYIVKDHNNKENKDDKLNNTLKAPTKSQCSLQPGSSDCSSCNTPGASTDLLPVMDPLFNMREICKQSILLEDHLFQKKKRCKDCCIKHQLTIEALAEEAITLDKDRKCEDLYYLPDKIRDLQRDFVKGRDPGEIAHEYRKLRKSLMQRCFNVF